MLYFQLSAMHYIKVMYIAYMYIATQKLTSMYASWLFQPQSGKEWLPWLQVN